MNEFTFSEITVGMKETFTRKITSDMEDIFRKLSGDGNPLHSDDEFALEVGEGKFPGHVTFGMLTASFYSTLAGMYLPGKYSLIHSFEELSFLKPVFAGDLLTVAGEVFEKEEAFGLIRIKAVIRNQYGNIVSRAKMKVLVMRRK